MSASKGASGSGKSPYGPGATGRPKGRTTRPKPFFLMHENSDQMPDFIQTAKDLMNTYGSNELPSGLQPRWLLNKKNQNISKGMTKGK